MVSVNRVSKNYGAVKAVSNVSLEIGKGSLFGLIGPDGAGKTTLFRMITTLLMPDTGNITISGNDSVTGYRKIRKFTGYMPGRFSLYPDLTVKENLTFYATIFGTTIQRNYELIKPVYSFLEPFQDRLANNLSGGMKQKLALCCALIHNPELLVLDEPTTGVDAVSRKEFWETLHVLKENGMTILVSTPYMDEASKCDRIAMLQGGKIILEDSPAALLDEYTTPLFEIHSHDRLAALEVLRAVKEVKRAYLFGQSIHISLYNTDMDTLQIKQHLEAKGMASEVVRIKPDFEDCFIDRVIEMEENIVNE